MVETLYRRQAKFQNIINKLTNRFQPVGRYKKRACELKLKIVLLAERPVQTIYPAVLHDITVICATLTSL